MSSLSERHLRVGILALVILIALLGFSNPAVTLLAQTAPPQWANAVNAANKEGKVVVFGPAGEVIRNGVVDGFKKSFPGIILEYVGGRAVGGSGEGESGARRRSF